MRIESFPTFTDIDNTPLRVWNRTVTATNINADHGEDYATQYMEQFSEQEQRQMFMMLMMIKKKGRDHVHAQVSRGVFVTEEDAANE